MRRHTDNPARGFSGRLTAAPLPHLHRPLFALAAGLVFLTLTPPAQAAPVHPPNEARDIAGLNHACGVATDSNGDVYLSSAGESKIEVYDPSHTELTSIEDTNEPCGLAVDSRGELLVSDQATGEVVRYVPNAYPFSGAPSYGSAEPVGEGGKKAKGISIDPFDNRLYVAEGTRVTSYGSEVQQFEIREATGGTYKLKFKGEETASLPFNASNAEVQAALESLPALGTGSVAVSGTSSATAWPHRIAFVGSAGFADVGRVEALPSLAGNEVDKLTVEATAGTYKLKFEGEETAAIEFNASASGAGSVQEALVALPTLAPGDVSVTGGPGDAGGTSPYVVAFEGASAGRNVGFLSPVTAALIGTASVSSKDGAETRYLAKATSGGRGFDEIQLLNVAKATAGTYKLKFKGEETASLPFNASAAEVQAALEALAAIAPGDVSVFLERSPTFSSRPYVLVFGGALASADVPQVEAVSSLLPNPGAEAGSSTEVGGWSGRVGEGTLTEASGVASYTVEPTQAIPSAPGTDRYLSVADAGGLAADQLYLFGGQDLRTLKLRRKINGAATPDGSFGFGAAGAYLAADPGNINRETKKCPEQKQACTAGHLFLYDAAHEALDEFDASGEYLGQTKNAAFADAKPTAVAIDRSGGAGDGTIYVTAGAGGEALAFEPLLAPKRETLEKPLSHELAKAGEVATDSHGDLYAVAGTFVHVYKPDGGEILTEGKPLIEDKLAPQDIAVDSTGKVYVLDGEKEVTYYTPSAYPPVAGTTYSRHLTPVATVKEFPNADEFLRAIAVNPGPGPGKDRLFVATHEYDSAANGSTLLDSEFAKGLVGHVRESIAVNGASGTVYFSVNPHLVIGVDPLGKEIVARIDTRVSQNGQSGSNPYLAVDQANGHVLEFDGVSSVVHEYDAAGSFVAQFGTFTEKISRPTRVAVDSACAVHEPPLTGAACESFDPANGNAYVAFDGSNPFDVTAFGPLRYVSGKRPPVAVTGGADEFGPGSATLRGTVNPEETPLEECKFEYLTEDEYETNGETFAGAEEEACAESPAEIGEGVEPVPVHAGVGSLDPEAPYRFRLVAKNSVGTDEGEAALFGPPVLTAKEALPVLYNEATLRAEISPSGLATKYHFDYLDLQSFEEQGGFEGPATHHSASAELAPGEAAVPVSVPLVGLSQGTEYRYRAVAENDVATVSGLAQAFVTQVHRLPENCSNAAFRFGLSANLPDCRAYELVTPAQTNGLTPYSPDDNAPVGANRGFNNWLTVQHGEGAGERLSYFTEGTLPGFEGNGLRDGYRAERGAGDHPAGGWQSALFSPDYAESVPGTHEILNSYGVAPDQLYSLWEINPEPEAFPATRPHGIYLGTPTGFEALGRDSLGKNIDLGAHSQYVSAGGAHAIFTSKKHLGPGAPPEPTQAVYDRAAGKASATTVVSTPPSGASPSLEAEFENNDATYLGASEDGSAVAFSVNGTLYLHRAGKTTEIAKAPNTFAGISEGGTMVFYAATADGESPAALHACDAEAGPCAGPEAHPPEEIAAAGIFAAVSPDGTHAFFSEEGEAGAHNLYAWDNTGTRFIGRLSAEDFEDEAFAGVPGMNLAAWTRAIGRGLRSGRVYAPTRSSIGGAFAFQSHARLTAYDNEGVGEIYRYDPTAEAGQRLLCVSCDPSGAPPSTDALFEDIRAGSPVSAMTMIANLTEGGEEVFFQSPDRLVPEDANEAEDVYEWRAKGSGIPECTRTEGCLALISSGQGEKPSFLYAMSGDGHDVFLQTKETLVGADEAGSPSIYDAREGGGIPEPVPPAPCQGDACQGQGSEPPAIPSPTSTGAGESTTRPKARPCGKGRRRVKGRCVKRPAKHKHHRRAKHNRRAGK